MSSSSHKTYRRVPAQKSVEKVDRDSNVDPKYRSGVNKLQELFPNWSQQDLQSLLIEVGNDIETAVTRISEGHAEQWGSVSRKKDKKTGSAPLANATNNSYPTSTSSSHPRGGRGATRGGRGGSTRGGRGGGPSRSSTPRSGVNGTSSHAESAPVNGAAAGDTWGTSDATAAGTTENTNGWGSTTNNEWGSTTNNDWASDQASASVPAPEVASPEPTQKSSVKVIGTSAPVSPPVKSTPAAVGGKMSWAQIARPQEKPKPAPPPPAPPVVEEPPVSEPPAEQAHEPEDPTTVQAPTWDEEPAHAHIVAPSAFQTAPTSVSPSVSANLTVDEDGWITAKDSKDEPSAVAPPSVPEPEKTPAELSPLAPVSTPALTTGSSASTASPTPPPTQTQKRLTGRFKSDQPVVMPSFGQSFGNSFGFGSAVGAMGMQFGSLNIGGDDDGPAPEPSSAEPEAEAAPAPTVQPTLESASAVPTPAPTQPTHSPQQQVQTQTQSPVQSFLSQTTPALPDTHSAVTHQPTSVPSSQAAPTPLASLAAASFFQPQSTQSQHTAASTTPSFSSFNPLGQQPQQSTQSNQITPSSIPQQQASPLPQSGSYGAASSAQHSSLASHGHTDAHTQPSSYYRQQDYGAGFNPAGNSLLSSMGSQQQQHQSQAQESTAPGQSAYAPFSSLATSATAQNPISNFANNPQQPDFGNYADQRGFYEGSYSHPAQQSGFTASRNFLGHEEISKLGHPHHQQQPQSTQPSNSISPSAAASSQVPLSQQSLSHSQTPPASSQGQPASGGQQQQSQQGYPQPVPYYHYTPYYGQPNPYYGGPNPGYGVNLGQVQPFMKYPVYPQGGVPPAGPGTPNSISGAVGVQGKVGSQSGPPGPNSYGAHSGLYGATHHQAGYDDGNYAPQHHQLQHQHQPQQASAGEYGKPPGYGLSQSHSQSLLQTTRAQQQQVQTQAQAQQNASPENAYKQYGAAKPGGGVDSTNVNLRGSVQPSYSATGAGAAGRFGANVTAPPGVGVQGQGSYPQGGVGDGGNYYQQYQRPQYWQ